jgi:peptidoglycan/xylan/chitin deacetylase (PgdA/CDA1 family)
MNVSASPPKRFLKRWSRRLFSLGARGLRLGKSTKGLRILTYHRVDLDGADPFAVPPKAFRRQMEALSRTGVVAPLKESVEAMIRGDDKLLRIAITFDDGTADFLSQAAPILEQFSLPATLYVNPDRVGSPGFLGWEDLRRLSSMGVSVESHGMDHQSMGQLSQEQIRIQVTSSRRILEDRLGKEVTSLAYPFGTVRDFNQQVKEQVQRAGYRSACTSVNGVNSRGIDPFELRRTKIEQGDDPIFAWILDGYLDGWAYLDRHMPQLQNRYS